MSEQETRVEEQLELLQCPFCGSSTAFLTDELNEDGYWTVLCSPCKAGTASFGEAQGAVKAWNTRVVSSPASAQCAEWRQHVERAVAEWSKKDFVSALNPRLNKLVDRLTTELSPLLPPPADSERRCVLCGHNNVGLDGICQHEEVDGIVKRTDGCRCVFATTVPTGETGCVECPRCYHSAGIRTSGQCAARSHSGYLFCSCRCAAAVDDAGTERLRTDAREVIERWDDLTDLETRIKFALANAEERGAQWQRESDAKLVENYHECPSTNDYNIAAAIRANASTIPVVATTSRDAGEGRQDTAMEIAKRIGLLRSEKQQANRSGNKYDIAFIDGGLGVLEKLLEDLIEVEDDTVGDVRDRAEKLIATAPADAAEGEPHEPRDYAVVASTQCLNCGGGIAESWTYCHRCGANRETTVPPTEATAAGVEAAARKGKRD